MSMPEFIESKIIDRKSLPQAILRWKLKGYKVVFTNGVYDILHRGHVTLLAKAAEMGHLLVVGLNADKSVRTLGKGDDRPINAELDRAFVLSGLSTVSAVVIFDDSTPLELIRTLQPDVLVKGGDYDPEQKDSSKKDYIVGSDLQRQRGASTVAIPLVKGYSTTAVAKKLADGKN